MQDEGEKADGDGGTQLPSPVWDCSLQAGSDHCPRNRYRCGPTSGGELSEIFYLLVLNIPQTGNLSTKKKNIHLFLKCAGNYGVPEKYLFKPDDLVVQAHFYK